MDCEDISWIELIRDSPPWQACGSKNRVIHLFKN